MSIAVSVVVQPSKMLFGLCAALCCGCAGLGLAVMLGAVPSVSPAVSLVAALSCVFCAGLGLYFLWRKRRVWQLDISGTGQIRLRGAPLPGEKTASEEGILVRLLADSTMWPGFLLLRLGDGEGRVHHVAILPDSLPADAFRAVSVACRWIAAHRFTE